MSKNLKENKVDIVKKRLTQGIGGMILLVIILILIFGSFYTISAGERGVLLTFGKPSPVVISEGLHFKIPIAQKVIKMEVRSIKYEADASAASKDLQIVSAKIATNYHLIPESVPEIYSTLGLSYAERIIQPMEQEIVKATTAKFTAEELITKREEVRQEIKNLFTERLRQRGIVVEEISITNFDFSGSFNAAIESKVTAEQLKLKADRDLERIRVEAEQRITQAKAEAEAIKIQAQAITSQGGKDYVQLQAINKWNGQLPGVTGGVVPFLDVGNVGQRQN